MNNLMLSIMFSFAMTGIEIKPCVYNIHKLTQSIKIDADWDKEQWNNIKAIELNNYMGDKPAFSPSVQAKMMY